MTPNIPTQAGRRIVPATTATICNIAGQKEVIETQEDYLKKQEERLMKIEQ